MLYYRLRSVCVRTCVHVRVLHFSAFILLSLSLSSSHSRFRILDEFPAEDYCDVYWIKFDKIRSALISKKKLDNRSFYGISLHVCYAPEFESVSDTREKLSQRRKVIIQKTQGIYS